MKQCTERTDTEDVTATSPITILDQNNRTTTLNGAIRCVHGCLWITIENDPTDHIVRAGESFTPPTGRRAIVMGLPRGGFTPI
jgi:hypothetical protein